MLRTLTVLLMIASLLACTTTQVVDQPPAQLVRERVEVGDTVTILARNGTTYVLKVTAVEQDALIGYDAEQNKNWKMPFDQIKSMHLRELDAGKSVAAGVGITLGTLVTLAIIGAAIFAYALKHAFDNGGSQQQNN